TGQPSGFPASMLGLRPWIQYSCAFPLDTFPHAARDAAIRAGAAAARRGKAQVYDSQSKILCPSNRQVARASARAGWRRLCRGLFTDLSTGAGAPRAGNTVRRPNLLVRGKRPDNCGPSKGPPSENELLSLIQAAGWPVWFLIIASIAAVALIIERFLSLKRAKVLPPGLLEEVLGLRRAQPMTPELLNKLAANSPLGRVLASGLRNEGAGRELMKEAMEETGRAVAHDLERYLSALGTIAATAPL